VENEWRELYYSLWGMIRNEIRTGHSDKERIDEIEKVLADHLKRHRRLENEVQ